MGTANRDASQIILKKQQKMLYAWKSANDSLVNTGRSVLQEQPTQQKASVVLDRRQGGCKCSDDASTNPYEFNGASKSGGNWS